MTERVEFDPESIEDRLREVSDRWREAHQRIMEDPRGQDDLPPGASFENYLRKQNAELDELANEALAIVDSMYGADFDYEKAAALIEASDAGWMFSMFLDRAIESAHIN